MRGLVSTLALYSILFWAAAPASAQSCEAWSARAQTAEKKGDIPAAVEYWTSALRVWASNDGKPLRARAFIGRARLYAKTGEADKALADFNAAVKLDPQSATAFDSRGQLYLEHGRITEARSDFYKAVQLSPRFGPAFYHRGIVHAKQGDAVFAKEDFRTACALKVQEACQRVGKSKPAKKSPPAKKQAHKRPAAKKAPVTEASPPASAPAEPEPEAAAAPEPPEPPDMRACAAALKRCSDSGKAINLCVRDARPCEKSRSRGCCPELCLREFQRKSSPDRSDAEIFRQIFESKAACHTGAPSILDKR